MRRHRGVGALAPPPRRAACSGPQSVAALVGAALHVTKAAATSGAAATAAMAMAATATAATATAMATADGGDGDSRSRDSISTPQSPKELSRKQGHMPAICRWPNLKGFAFLASIASVAAPQRLQSQVARLVATLSLQQEPNRGFPQKKGLCGNESRLRLLQTIPSSRTCWAEQKPVIQIRDQERM